MKKDFSGLDARFWNLMFHEADGCRRKYRTAAGIEAVVIAVLVATILLMTR